jgi:hypothetical protein
MYRKKQGKAESHLLWYIECKQIPDMSVVLVLVVKWYPLPFLFKYATFVQYFIKKQEVLGRTNSPTFPT